MIVYLDSSVIVRALLPDEDGHAEARAIVLESSDALITGSWTRVEVASSLSRAAKAARGDARLLRDAIDAIFDGQYVVSVDAEQAEIEYIAHMLVWETGVRSLDAWHLACAQLAREELVADDEELGFISYDKEQVAAASQLGFAVL